MGKKISLQRQSVIESAMWNRAGSLGEEVSASAASIAHGRVTSVGTKRALAGLIPAPPAQAPRPPPRPDTRGCEQVRTRRFLAPPGASRFGIGVKMSLPLLSRQIQYHYITEERKKRCPYKITLHGRRLQ